MKPTLLSLAFVAATSVVACSRQETPASQATAAVAATPNFAIGMPARLCDVLQKVAPEVRGMGGLGAQAKLVTSIAEAFEYKHDTLARVTSEIDVIATSGCPTAREQLLAVLTQKSLQEAVR